jgi:hypothetical protein
MHKGDYWAAAGIWDRLAAEGPAGQGQNTPGKKVEKRN